VSVSHHHPSCLGLDFGQLEVNFGQLEVNFGQLEVNFGQLWSTGGQRLMMPEATGTCLA
jgi:hypothetical protein